MGAGRNYHTLSPAHCSRCTKVVFYLWQPKSYLATDYVISIIWLQLLILFVSSCCVFYGDFENLFRNRAGGKWYKFTTWCEKKWRFCLRNPISITNLPLCQITATLKCIRSDIKAGIFVENKYQMSSWWSISK